MGNSGQEGPAVSASGQNLAPMSRDLVVVSMADHRSPLVFDLSDGVREWSFPLGSTTPSNGGFLNPGVWFMLLTQLTG